MRFLRMLLRLLSPNAEPGHGERLDQASRLEREARRRAEHLDGPGGGA